MSSAAGDYITARAKVEGFRKQFDEIAKMLDRVAVALHDLPERFAFINLRQPHLPSSAFGAVEADALKWLSATEIQALLAEFHKAHRAHIDLYRTLPNELRGSVALPLAREYVTPGVLWPS